jgi:hypothetical protein
MDRWLTGAVVIVGCEPVVETNSLQMGTNEFFSYLVRLVANKGTCSPATTATRNWGDAIKAQRPLSCSSRGEPFPAVFVMEAAENHANCELAVLGEGMSVVTLQRSE